MYGQTCQPIRNTRTTRGSMSRRYTTETVRDIEKRLRDLPPVRQEDHSTRETIRMLAGEIRKLQKRGYTLEQIAGELRGDGLGIAPATLAAYLRPDRRKAGTAAKPAGQKRADPAPATAGKTEEPAAAPSRGTFTPLPDPDDL